MSIRNQFAVTATILALGSTTALVSSTEPQELAPQKQPGIFAQPRIFRSSIELQQQLLAAFAGHKFTAAETIAQKMAALQPDRFASHYNLACAQARNSKAEAALESLRRAIELGFRGQQRLETDKDLASLRILSGWPELLREAGKPEQQPPTRHVTPGNIVDGVAMVEEANTAWDPKLTQLRVFFKSAGAAGAEPTIVAGSDEVATLINEWAEAGTATGLGSVLYDNHDRDHSNMNVKRYPQLARVEYSNAAALEKLSNGLQHHMYFNRTTLGNSSTSLVGGPFWRSQPRFAYTNTRSAEILAFQYFRNHLYVYPEHRDYDPGLNGTAGYGDVYPANTPYVIISQGSSGSDRVFLDAIAATLAAFRPDVFKTLEANGTVYPCVQMIMRRCLKSVHSDAEYLTGIAHPPVFDGSQLDPLAMVKMAHEITVATIPPVAVLSVQKEEAGVVGRDYFDVSARETLFTTPAAIARVCRTMNLSKVITIDASGSQRDPNKMLTWHWKILQGDPGRIQITPQNEQTSIATITVQHHERRPIREGLKMESSRVDIGVFVSDGTHYSPPSIVSFYWPEDETRTYDDAGAIESVQYTDHASGGNYTDPMIITAKNWKDEYLYSKTGDPIGWNRIRNGSTQRFTRDGLLALTFDERMRPLSAQSVNYIAKPRPNIAPLLEQVPGQETFEYEYSSENDVVGQVRKKAKSTEAGETN